MAPLLVFSNMFSSSDMTRNWDPSPRFSFLLMETGSTIWPLDDIDAIVAIIPINLKSK